MEQRTTTNENLPVLETPLINGRRESMELGQVSLETNADEPIWLKILCVLGGVYPILRKNGKCKCNRKTIGWSILPFIATFYWLLLVTFSKQFFFIVMHLSISYTRKRFSDAIVGEENRRYVNIVAKRGLMISAIAAVILLVMYIPAVYPIWWNLGLIWLFFFIILCMFTLIILHCFFLTHTSVAQVKTGLLKMARGTEVEEVQTKLLEISKMIQEASVGYLQVPLSVLFVLGMSYVIYYGILAYRALNLGGSTIYGDTYTFIALEAILGTAIVTPLWLLTRIEKFYLWTLRELLHHNTVMPRTEHTNLVAIYDTIAPRASIFGIYITRGRVASIAIAIFGSIAPKIGIYLYQKL
jgi:hypothetical protein